MEYTNSTKKLTENQKEIIRQNVGKVHILVICEMAKATKVCIRTFCEKHKLELAVVCPKKEKEDWEGEDSFFKVDKYSKHLAY
jgi:hypothetical protein